MKENGQLRTCDRCGVTVFLKCTGETVRDGGYSRWDCFEHAEGWSEEFGIGDLCPACTSELIVIMEEYARKKNSWFRGAKMDGGVTDG